MTKAHVVSIVFNGVNGDSRVIKTARAAQNAGHQTTLIGVSQSETIQRIDVEGIPVVLVPHRASWLKNLGLWGGRQRDIRLIVGCYLKEVLPEIVALKPDIIHSHDMLGVKIGAAAVRALAAEGIPARWVHDIHEFVAGIRGELQEQYIPACIEWEENHFPEIDHLLTVSDALADEIAKRYPVRRPTVTYNTPSRCSFRNSGADVRSALGLEPEKPLVVYIGGASELRGCATILNAVATLPDVHLAFVSRGPYVDGLAARANTIGMKRRFHVLPYVPSDQVTTFIRTADIGIHGMVHYPNGEVAMPNKMFEYLHAGLPMVVSDVASMKAFVGRHGLGVTFVAEDIPSCASAIQKALTGAERYRNNITPELKREFSWEEQERKIHAIYGELLEAPLTTPNAKQQAASAAWLRDDAHAHNARLQSAAEAVGNGKTLPPVLQRSAYLMRRFMHIAQRDGIAVGLGMSISAVRRKLFGR